MIFLSPYKVTMVALVAQGGGCDFDWYCTLSMSKYVFTALFNFTWCKNLHGKSYFAKKLRP